MAYNDPFYQKVKAVVDRHGEKAKRLWEIASGYNPMVPPATALSNLKNILDVIRSDFKGEARALIRDLDELFKR